MARNGSGTFSLPQAPFVTNTTISSTATNSNNSDIAAALTQSISKDGQTTYTGNQPMGGNKLTGLGVGTAVADSAAMSQLYGVPTYGGVGGGTADAITITPSPGVTAYAIGQKFSFKASATNTGAVTLNVNSVGAGAVTWPDGTALVAADIASGAMIEVEVQATTPVFHLQTTSAKAQAPITGGTFGQSLISLAAGTPVFGAAQRGVRQTVAAGPVDTAGLPTFLPSTSVNLNLTSQNIASGAPFVATAANNWSNASAAPLDVPGVSTANLTWTGLTASRAAATPNFLYVTISGGVLSTGFTVTAPVYQWGGTPAITSGLFTFNISEMKGYLGNGSTAPQTNLVMVGEAATDGTTVISTVAYAYNGRYDSGYTATLPAATVSVSKNHNIGVKPTNAHFIIENTTTEAGYAVGDQVIDPGGDNGSYTYQAVPRMTAKTIARTSGSANSGTNIINATTGATAVLTVGNWKYKLVADRGW